MTGQIDERVVQLNHEGAVLRSIETFPEEDAGSRPIIVFPPSGLKYSAGPHRIFVGYARQLASEGFLCYRFDPRGIGLSDGVFGGGTIHELWNRIEEGCFVEDLAYFIGRLRQTWSNRPIVICGLCGGAVTAALLANRHGRLIDGIVSINIEVFHSQTDPLPAGSETRTHVNQVMRKYATKLFSRDAWARLLRLESDLKGIVRFTGSFLLQGFQKEKRRLHDYRDINLELISAFRTVKEEGINHLMLFSQNSSSWQKFQGTYFPLLLESRYSSPYGEIRVLPDALHELHTQEHRTEALRHIKRWLDASFPGPESDHAGYDTSNLSTISPK